MPDMGTTQMLSIRIAAENPASAADPKLLTTDCTSIIPIETVDCCRMEGMAMRVMETSSFPSKTEWLSENAVIAPTLQEESSMEETGDDIFFRIFSSTSMDRTAEIPCAISVAHATPETPMWAPATRR